MKLNHENLDCLNLRAVICCTECFGEVVRYERVFKCINLSGERLAEGSLQQEGFTQRNARLGWGGGSGYISLYIEGYF